MTERKIKAIFVGSTELAGYVKGMQYELCICMDGKNKGIIIIWPSKPIRNSLYVWRVQYESVVAFLDNWDNIINVL